MTYLLLMNQKKKYFKVFKAWGYFKSKGNFKSKSYFKSKGCFKSEGYDFEADMKNFETITNDK
jgi:hypothetical protein